VKLETLEGNCGNEALLFNMFEGQASDGAQKIVKTGMGCQILISLGNTTKPWDIIFESIKLDD